MIDAALDWEATTPLDDATPFQLWKDLRLPRCGICASFGQSSSSATRPVPDAKCAPFDDVTTPHGVRLKHASDSRSREGAAAHSSPLSPASQSIQTSQSTSSPSTTATSDATPTNTATSEPPHVTSATTAQPHTTPPTTTQPSVKPATQPVTMRPDPKTNSLSANVERDGADSTASSMWTPTSFYVLLPLMAIIALALVLVVALVRRRRYRAAQGAGSGTTAPLKRGSQRYSRVVSDDVTPSSRDAARDDDDDDHAIADREYGEDRLDIDSDNDVELELEQRGRRSLGRRPTSPRRGSRPLSPRRPHSPQRSVSPTKRPVAHVGDNVVV